VVEFHPPAPPQAFFSRKALADYCNQRVAAGVARALAGRPFEAAPAADAREAAE
jgi:hypothetical protein